MEDNKNLVEVKNLEVSFFTYAGEVKAVRGLSLIHISEPTRPY